MIRIDREKCNLCRNCVDICHTACMSVCGDELTIDYPLCSTCCQCIAVCPRGALSWDGAEPRELKGIETATYQQLVGLLKARRTTRRFKDMAVEREKLEKLCRTVKLAPTNIYDLEVIVVGDKAVIDELGEMGRKGIRRMYWLFYRNPLGFAFLKRFGRFSRAVNDIDRRKVFNSIEKGSTNLHGAPVLIMLTGDPWIGFARISAHYALYNMILTAQALGLGSCISGNSTIFFGRNKRARELLGIPGDRSILAVLEVGYPAVRFRHSVEGNYPAVRWI
ncbi:MAG: nitroreductase family protein [Actinobacteria bacterium]|nr:nitroreductase family protein [Actinomycetota bacterium]